MFAKKLFVVTGDAKSANISSAEVAESMTLLQALRTGGATSIVVGSKKVQRFIAGNTPGIYVVS